jgi:hypothetical protein
MSGVGQEDMTEVTIQVDLDPRSIRLMRCPMPPRTPSTPNFEPPRATESVAAYTYDQGGISNHAQLQRKPVRRAHLSVVELGRHVSTG